MKKIIVLFMLGLLIACGESDELDKQEAVNDETMEKLTKVQELNVELEQIDGELDSLINSVN